MKTFITVAVMVLILAAGYVPAHATSAGDVPPSKIAAYIEVSRMITINPAISQEGIEAALKEHELTMQDYESIGQQVQSDPELKKQVDEGLNKLKSQEEKAVKAPDIRTKLKEAPGEHPKQ